MEVDIVVDGVIAIETDAVLLHIIEDEEVDVHDHVPTPLVSSSFKGGHKLHGIIQYIYF